MYESLISLIIATALLLGSPGPAPLALAAASASFGVKNSLHFFAGILTGLLFVIGGAMSGLASLFGFWPKFELIVKIAGAAYIIYIAIKVAIAPVNNPDNSSKVLGFADGFIFNLLNPKAYAALFALISQFLLPFPNSNTSLFVTGLVCFIVAFIVDFIWLCMGGMLKRLFESPRFARPIRIIFAVLMVMTVLVTLQL